MELSNNEVYTTSSNDFSGKGFAFPEIQLGGPVELTPEEVAVAASATPDSGVDFALTSGEFGGQGDLADEGLGHVVGISYLGHSFATVEDSDPQDDSAEMGSDGDDQGDPGDPGETEIAEYHEAESGYVAMTGFDPERADDLAEELGEELVSLAKEVAQEFGPDAAPEAFIAALHARRSALRDEDYEVELRAKRLGGLANPEQEASSVCRLADHGAANLRIVEGEVLLVPAGAAPQDVVEAARRSRNDRLARIARTHSESEREARLARSKERATRTMFEKEIRSNMKAAAERAKAGTPVPNARAEAVQGLRAYRKHWDGLPEDRKALVADPGTDAGIKRAFAQAASSRAAEASFKRARDLGKAFPAPEVPFNGTCILEDWQQELKEIASLKRASREGSPGARAELRQRAAEVAELEALKAEVLRIERLRSTRQALKKAQPNSPAANQAGLSITRRPRVSAFYCTGEGVAHARPEEAWFAPVTTTVFGDKPAEPRRFQPMKALVARAIDALYGRKAKSQPEPQGFDPNAWADRVPEAEGESGPDQRGAAAPREYNPAHRRDAQVVTATGRVLDPSRNGRQTEAASRRISKVLAKASEKVASPQSRAWHTALSLYLGEIEDPAERLELMLQTRGRQSWAKLEAGSKNLAKLKEAARALADAGKLKAIRGRDSGTLYIVATEALEGEKRAELEHALLRLMVTGRVAVPRGTKLARRVAAHKGVITREASALANAGSKVVQAA